MELEDERSEGVVVEISRGELFYQGLRITDGTYRLTRIQDEP
jgi:hypothetical protein